MIIFQVYGNTVYEDREWSQLPVKWGCWKLTPNGNLFDTPH